MSNPTTPFNWQMPTNTDLVTDLPADFEVFGQAVATSMADLLGGTTGQILSKATNANMDFTWVSANPGDITGVTAGTGISGGGTSGDVTITNSMATAIDAKGDLIGGTGADTFARLAVGANDTVLTADSTTATGMKWATPSSGGMTLLSTTNLTGTSTTVSSINQTYKDLIVQISGASSSSAFVLGFQYNSVTSGYFGIAGAEPSGTWQRQTNSGDMTSGFYDIWAASNANSTVTYSFPMYSSTGYHNVTWQGTYFTNTSVIRQFLANASNSNTSAITSITATCSAGSFNSGTIRIYGVK